MGATQLASLGLHLRRRAPAKHYLFAFLMALVGGLLGIAGAVVGEAQSGGWLLLPIVGAPIIEEAMKPAGVYIGLLRWPEVFASRLYTAVLAGVGGLVFGIVEAVVYTQVYVSDPSDAFVLYRFTLPLVLHATASFVYGLGISSGIIDWAAGRSRFPKRARNFYIAAVLIHALYNTTAVVLELSNAIDID